MALDPKLLARLGPLQVRARKVMEGVLTGLHQSPQHGQSVEFAEHKEYAPGDEIRHIDWRAYAKVDRYYVKRFEMETNLRALLVVDASGSMAYGRGGVSKLEYASICAGALAVLLARQGDQVGLLLAGSGAAAGEERLPAGVRGFLPFAASAAHVQEVLRRLEAARGEGPTVLPAALDFAAEKAGRRALIVVLSDLFDPTEQSVPALKRLRSRRHDLLVLQTLDREELDFPFDDPTRFLSMEDERQIDAQPRQIRQSYLAELRRFLEQTRRELTRADVEYELIPTDAAPDRELLKLLRRREAGGGPSRPAHRAGPE
ncbi:MAG TPA: DUF58 domain-containing protein [Myxococcales bacterium]|nr:DUF58 domain-containing protein [Myxococcales bacterium]